MASVRKRKWTHNGVEKEAWCVEYTDRSGARRRFTPKSGLKKDADKERLRIENEVENGSHVALAESITVSQLCDQFLDDCERRGKSGDRMSGHSLATYRSVIRCSIKPALGQRKLARLTSDDVQHYFDDLAKSYAPAGARARAVRFNTIVKFAIRRKWLKTKITSPEVVKWPSNRAAERVIPSKADIRKLLDVVWEMDSRERLSTAINRNAVLCLGVFAGLRAGEMFGLQWENVDFDAGVLHIRHSFSVYDGLKNPKSRAGIRDVPITAPVKQALIESLRFWQMHEDTEHLRARHGDSLGRKRRAQMLAGRVHVDLDRPRSGYVLRAEKTNAPIPSNAAGKTIWIPLMKKAGLMVDVDGIPRPKFTIHALRHAAASLFIEAGLPAFNLKSVIGHSSVAVTYNIYGHLFPEDQRTIEAAASIAASLGATTARQIRASI